MKTCLCCGEEIKSYFKSQFCSSKCREMHDNSQDYDRFIGMILVKEEPTSDICNKYIRLPYKQQSRSFWNKDILLQIVNEWKRFQDKRIRIIDIDTSRWLSYYSDECTPWCAEITYTFDDCDENTLSHRNKENTINDEYLKDNPSLFDILEKYNNIK